MVAARGVPTPAPGGGGAVLPGRLQVGPFACPKVMVAAPEYCLYLKQCSALTLGGSERSQIAPGAQGQPSSRPWSSVS